jgi:hypothetical protein
VIEMLLQAGAVVHNDQTNPLADTMTKALLQSNEERVYHLLWEHGAAIKNRPALAPRLSTLHVALQYTSYMHRKGFDTINSGIGFVLPFLLERGAKIENDIVPFTARTIQVALSNMSHPVQLLADHGERCILSTILYNAIKFLVDKGGDASNCYIYHKNEELEPEVFDLLVNAGVRCGNAEPHDIAGDIFGFRPHKKYLAAATKHVAVHLPTRREGAHLTEMVLTYL